MYSQPSPPAVARNLLSGLKVSEYAARLWSAMNRIHSPVAAFHNRAVPSNDVLAFQAKVNFVMLLQRAHTYVANISCESEVFGHQPIQPIESVCPARTIGSYFVAGVPRPGMSSASPLLNKFSRLHMQAVWSSEHDASRVLDGLNLIWLTSFVCPL